MWKKFILLAVVTAMSLTGAALAAASPAPPSPSKVSAMLKHTKGAVFLGMAPHRDRCSNILPSWNPSREPGRSGSSQSMNSCSNRYRNFLKKSARRC